MYNVHGLNDKFRDLNHKNIEINKQSATLKTKQNKVLYSVISYLRYCKTTANKLSTLPRRCDGF